MSAPINFDKLPDGAVVSVKVVALVTDLSEHTIWRRAKTEPLLKPVTLGPRCTRWNVGKLRRYMSGEKGAA